MHTIFINTSNHTVGGSLDVLSIEREFRQLNQFDVPLSALRSEAGGFRAYAEKIGEMIDNYRELRNDYNLIVYVDLLEVQEYRDLVCSKADSVSRNAAYEVIRGMCVRFLTEAIYDALEELGRRPSGKMLLLLEQNHRSNVDAGRNSLASGDIYSLFDREKCEALFDLLGFPSAEDMTRQMAGLSAEERSRRIPEIFGAQGGTSRLVQVRKLYEEKINILVKSLTSDSGYTPDRAYMDFSGSVQKQYQSDLSNKVVISEFETDRRDRGTNKEQSTKRNMLLQCLLLHCVRTESIYRKGTDEGKKVPSLDREDWNQFFCMLSKKKSAYEMQEARLSSVIDSYTDLNLVPDPYRFAYEKFGLDEGGNRKVSYGAARIDPETVAGKAEKDPADPSEEKGLENEADGVELAAETGEVVNWFGQNTYEYFADRECPDTAAPKVRTAAGYTEKAEGIANYHLNFMTKLQTHVDKRMSNYAARSQNNVPPILRKRSVVHRNEQDVKRNDYKYSDKVKETNVSYEYLENMSHSAYVTVLLEYLKFSSSRAVAQTDMAEKCDRFVRRVHQIEASLKKLLAVTLVLLALLVFLILPYFMIQGEILLSNPLNGLIAGIFAAVPFLLLGVGYFVARFFHLRKMRKLWRELVTESDELTQKNLAAVRAYDELFVKHIPALRWVYEYRMDLDFYRDCCRIADAKLCHHREKLQEWRETVEHILEDMECGHCEAYPDDEPVTLDYTKAYCEGENRKFYSILDGEMLCKICRGEEQK